MPYTANVDQGSYPNAAEAAALSGELYIATFFQTIGGAANGFYSLSVFNPSNSGKNVRVRAIRGWLSGAAPLLYLFKTTSNPMLANAFTPINQRFGGAASAVSCTYNSASGGISFPGATNIDTDIQPSSSTVELLPTDDDFYILPNGIASGIQVVQFVGNSQQYGFTMKWSEAS